MIVGHVRAENDLINTFVTGRLIQQSLGGYISIYIIKGPHKLSPQDGFKCSVCNILLLSKTVYE
jgi:hypothetical protein